MTLNAHARSGYASAAAPVRSERDTEYAVFARVTHRMSAVDEGDKSAFPALAAAVSDNQRLWGVLAEDLLSEGNRLPAALKGQLVGLAEFVRKHTLRVLAGKAPVAPLVEINTTIMRGLRGQTAAGDIGGVAS
ncbi:flagellar biosynthesis regulator FlaF [Amaricoccus sp.]|uniref:flagellar biosynthesis regulator FlaF n=1 Tax=Amaricoccus sp. TaxID=1872485 RepID=UPI001B626017|nr:flagellar biosynthesis regulator FlaF [Amaricoccus sp.]MBP7001947.1 flagellar biosynthesis regulator FlaF [Amaricoccus sp.]